MAVFVSMLRAVNVGGHNPIKMDALRALYESLKLRDAQTYVQSGNVVFRTEERDAAVLAKRIENAIEQKFSCRTTVILRTTSELQQVIESNPFAGQRGIEPGKLLVTFLRTQPTSEGGDQVRSLKTDPEKLRLNGRELYIYFPDGAGRSKLSWVTIEKMLGIPGTARNWNSVTKLLDMAENLENSK